MDEACRGPQTGSTADLYRKFAKNRQPRQGRESARRIRSVSFADEGARRLGSSRRTALTLRDLPEIVPFIRDFIDRKIEAPGGADNR
jgi:hypothetical protein